MLSFVIFNKSEVDALTPKFWWYILDIQGSSSVKFRDNWMGVDSPFVFYKWSLCCWNEQWTTYTTPDFVDLILKLGWMFWARILCLGFSMFWVYNLFNDCIIYFGELYVMRIKIFLSLRVRLWLRYKFIY